MSLGCGTCGASIRDIPEENADFYERGQDQGFGICIKCGGVNHIYREYDATPEYLKMTEEEFRAQMGGNYCTFMDARINLIYENLSTEMVKEKFMKLPYWHKCHAITQAMEKGLIKW